MKKVCSKFVRGFATRRPLLARSRKRRPTPNVEAASNAVCRGTTMEDEIAKIKSAAKRRGWPSSFYRFENACPDQHSLNPRRHSLRVCAQLLLKACARFVYALVLSSTTSACVSAIECRGVCLILLMLLHLEDSK